MEPLILARSPAGNNTWFNYFWADSSHDWILIAVYGCRALWAALGILSNCFLVHVTLRNKDLHHVCNILIALEALLATLFNLNFFFSFAVVASGVKFIRYGNCFPWLFIPGVSGECAQLAMLLIGVDRLFSVLFPFWYKGKSKCWCISLASALLASYALYNSALLYLDFLQSKNMFGLNKLFPLICLKFSMVSCSSNEMIQSWVGLIMRLNTITVSLSLMSVYGLVWVASFLLKSSPAMSESNKHLLKSLVIIIGLDLFCVCFKNVTMLLINTVTDNPMVASSLGMAFSFLSIMVYSANGPVLCLISTVYRSKFRKHFKSILKNPKVFSQPPQVVPLHVQQNSLCQSRRSSRMIDVSQIHPY